MELEAARSEAEGAREQEENKSLRAQIELAQVQHHRSCGCGQGKNDKAVAQAVMDIVKPDKERFRLSHILVFSRAGIDGRMEEQCENKIDSFLAWLQAGARGNSSRMQLKKL